MGAFIVRDGFKVKSSTLFIDQSDCFKVWERVTKSGHGFSAGQVIYYDATSGYMLANAGAVSTAESIGIVESTTTNEFVYVQAGRIAISPSPSWVAGTVYYLSTDSGALTGTEPAVGNVVKPMLIATGSATGIVLHYVGTIAVQTNFENTALSSGQTITLDSFNSGASYSAAWHIAARKSDKSAMRSALLQSCWNDGTEATQIVETGTLDLGTSTADISFAVDVNSGLARLRVTNGGVVNNWNVRAKRILV